VLNFCLTVFHWSSDELYEKVVGCLGDARLRGGHKRLSASAWKSPNDHHPFRLIVARIVPQITLSKPSLNKVTIVLVTNVFKASSCKDKIRLLRLQA
jgi:hypothetical protein